MKERYWLIEGYDSTSKIYERKIKVGQMTEHQVKSTLMALVAKTGLTFDEIVGAYATRRTKIANDLLSVKRDGSQQVHSCGTNPHFIARIVTSNE